MGSCVSSHAHNNSRSSKVDQSMSIHNSSMPPTPIKDNYKPTHVDPSLLSFASKSRNSTFKSVSTYPSFGGSKDETFFDTQGWLDSDCDDDFYSVNGDFSSRGSTPAHHMEGTPRLSRVFSPQVNRALFEGKPPLRTASNQSRGSPSVRRSFSSTLTTETTEAISEGAAVQDSVPPATTKSKKLIDLFRESMRERDSVGLTPPLSLPPKPAANRAPSSLRYSVSVNNYKSEKEKQPEKFAHRCFPKLGYVRSFSDSKKTSNPPTSASAAVS